MSVIPSGDFIYERRDEIQRGIIMGIIMTGIDHSRADVDIRSLFSFTKKEISAFTRQLMLCEEISGCIIIATCNRLEVWADVTGDMKITLYERTCAFKQIDPEEFRSFFQSLEGREAVDHLFRLSCGLKSQILGEDQIITQVGDALDYARACECTDSVLEVLFRKAVTAAKKVKTEVVFPRSSSSVIDNAIDMIREKGGSISGKRCLVIGNGLMGKTAASALRDAGATVSVTVRKYIHGTVVIPDGCDSIDYQERYHMIPDCDYVISATTSPHFTITKDAYLASVREGGRKTVFIDLAVPRDVEEDIRSIPGIVLYDIDHFKSAMCDPKLEGAIKQAETILKSKSGEFYDWLNGRNMIARVQYVQEEAAEDVRVRLEKPLRHLALGDKEKKEFSESLEKSVSNVVGKLIFGLRDGRDPDEFRRLILAMEKLYE